MLDSIVKFSIGFSLIILSLFPIKYQQVNNYKDVGLKYNVSSYIVVDYRKSIYEKRFIVVENNNVVYETYVSHGSGSNDNGYAVRYSNREGSHMSSIGLKKIGDRYIGKHGVSWRLEGLERGVNSNDLQRAIVIHSAPYMNGSNRGLSWGCLVLSDYDKKVLTKYFTKGKLIFVIGK